MSAPAMETSARAMEMPVPAPTPAPFLGFTVDAETRSTLLALAGDRGWPAECVRDGCVREATAQLAGAATPETLVVDIGRDGSPFEDLSVLADACDAGTRVVVLGDVNDVALFRRLRALGVEDYLLKPVTREVLGAALRQSASARARGCSSSRPRNPSMRPIRGTRAPSRGCCEGSRGTSMPWSSICRAPWARRCP